MDSLEPLVAILGSGSKDLILIRLHIDKISFNTLQKDTKVSIKIIIQNFKVSYNITICAYLVGFCDPLALLSKEN